MRAINPVNPEECDHSKKIRKGGRTLTCSDYVLDGTEFRCRKCGKVLSRLGTAEEFREIIKKLKEEGLLR